VPVAVNPLPALGGDGKVGVKPDVPYGLALVEPVADLFLLGGYGLPFRNGVVLVKQRRLEDEVLILVQCHAGVLCPRIGGESGERPLVLSLLLPLEHSLNRIGVRLLRACQALWVELGVTPSIDLAPDLYHPVNIPVDIVYDKVHLV
jgi:hypothetical protein